MLLILSLLFNVPAWATVGVVKAGSGTTVYVCQANDVNPNCLVGSGGVSGYWTLTGADIHNNNAGNVGINTSSTLDYLTVSTNNSGGATINSLAMSNGIDAGTQMVLPLNNSLTDISVNNLTITNNNVTFANTTPAFPGTYYAVFNGTNAYLTSTTNVPISGTGDFSIAGWVYTSGLGSSNTLLCSGAYSSSAGICIIQDNSPKIYVYINGGGAKLSNTYTFPINTWMWVQAVRASGTLSLYASPLGASSPTLIGSVADSTNVVAGNAYIGALFNGSATQFWPGNIQDVQFANTALTTTVPTAPFMAANGSPQNTFSVNGVKTGAVLTNGNNNNNLELVSGSTDAVDITSVGNVGVNSVSPGQVLDVNGSIRSNGLVINGVANLQGGVIVGTSAVISSTSGTGNFVLSASPTVSNPNFTGTNTNPLIRGGLATTSTLTLEGTSANSPAVTSMIILQNTSGTGKKIGMSIDNASNVGIGTLGPVNSQFSVLGGVSLATSVASNFFTNSAPSGGIIVEGNIGIGTWITGGSLDIQGTTILDRFNTSGNVSIGTTASVQYLNIGAANQFTVSSVGAVNSGTVTSTGNIIPGVNSFVGSSSAAANASTIFRGSASTTGFAEIRSTTGSGAADFIKFTLANTGSTEAMRIQDNSGIANIGIGTQNPLQQLDVWGSLNGAHNFTVTNLGNVGVGSLTPGAALDVNGTVKILSAAAGSIFTVSGDGTTAHSFLINTNANVSIGTTLATKQLNIGTGGQFTVDSAGQTTTPAITMNSSTATITGSSATNGSKLTITADNATSGGHLDLRTSQANSTGGDHIDFLLGNAGATIGMTVLNQAGVVNVGIGTTSPGQALDVVGTIRASNFSGQAAGTILCLNSSGGIGYCSGVIAGILCTCN